MLLSVLVVEGVMYYKWHNYYYKPDVPVAESAEESTFIHTASENNSRGDYTYLTHAAIDGDPNAIVMAKLQKPRSAGSYSYDHNIGVWYDFVDREKWAVFNQDRAAVPAEAAFEIYIPPASESFVHHADDANIVGSSTYLDNPLTNGEPEADVAITQNWNPGGGVGVYNDHSVGIRYDEDMQQWELYNRDGAPIPKGTAFNVSVSEAYESTR